MEPDALYELVYEATQAALRDHAQPQDARMPRRLYGGKVLIQDSEGRLVKETEVLTLLKKVTAVREKLRVLEQKINHHPKLDPQERAELQVYLTRCYGSLTTLNFLFNDDADKFKGATG